MGQNMAPCKEGSGATAAGMSGAKFICKENLATVRESIDFAVGCSCRTREMADLDMNWGWFG